MIMITGTLMMTMNAWSISAVSHTMPAESSAPTNTSAVAIRRKTSINALDGVRLRMNFRQPSV